MIKQNIVTDMQQMPDSPEVPDTNTPEALYMALGKQSYAQAADLAPANVAQRYADVLTAKFDQLAAHRPTISRFFADTMQAEAHAGNFHTDPMRDVYHQVVVGATDAPTKPDDITGLSHLLYALYLMSVLFWLYDRTPQQQATRSLIDFMREMIRILRPMMMMPMFTKAMYRMTIIMDMVFLNNALAADTSEV